MQIKRREFLLWTGTAGAAAALDPMLSLVGETLAPEAAGEVPPGVVSHAKTTCLMCPGGCGLSVRRVDGKPVGIAGNPNLPVNAGGVCREGLASLQMLYHPDRLLRPLKRRSGDRPGDFQATTWDEALQTIGAAMGKTRQSGAPEQLAFVLGRTGGTMEALVRHFMSVWGSRSLFLDEQSDGCREVFEVMHGLSARPAFDFDNADLILSFGADLLNGWQSPLQFQRSLASLQSPTRDRRARLVVADIRYSQTAARAAEWIWLTPGSYGALALGIAYVMLREKLYDADFVKERLFGFEDVGDDAGAKPGYRSLVLKDYSPEVVSRLTGVPFDVILALGKAFGESPSALALFDENVAAQSGGLHAAMAIHSLNLLKGNINKPGGIYLQPKVPLSPLSDAAAKTNADAAVSTLEDLAEIAGTGRAPEVLFLYHSNPVYSSPFAQQIREALKKIPLVVSFTPFLDETAFGYAHYILPDAQPLERWDDRLFPPSFPVSGWGLVQPCAEPAGDVRASGDVILALAQRAGGSVAQAHPWTSFEQLLKHRARGLYEARAGSPCIEAFQQELVGEVGRRGWWLGGDDSFDEFWKRLLDAGGWADLNFKVRALNDYSGQPDGKIDLYCRRLREKVSAQGDRLAEIECLPHYHAEVEPRASLDYPLVLNPFRPGKKGGGTHGTLPWILQCGSPRDEVAWNSWAEISSSDARSRQIQTLDWIWVESPVGRVKLRAVVHPGAGPGVVTIPCGFGHKGMGRWARERGVNPVELLVPQRDPLNGLPYRFATRVRISKA